MLILWHCNTDIGSSAMNYIYLWMTILNCLIERKLLAVTVTLKSNYILPCCHKIESWLHWMWQQCCWQLKSHIESWRKWRPFHKQHSQMHFLENKWCVIKIQISLKFVSEGPINNTSPLVLVMACEEQGFIFFSLFQIYLYRVNHSVKLFFHAITGTNDDPDLSHHMALLGPNELTHWGKVIYLCVSKLTIIGSDNGLLPGQCQSVIWTNAGILLIRTLGTHFIEILSKIHIFFIKENAFQNVVCEMVADLFRPQCVKLPRKLTLLLIVC